MIVHKSTNEGFCGHSISRYVNFPVSLYFFVSLSLSVLLYDTKKTILYGNIIYS